MKTVAYQPQPPGFEEIVRAFDTALELPRWRDEPLRVGLCRPDGELLATGTLQDHRQARLFCIQMEAMGWRELGAGQGCDRVFRREAWQVAELVNERALEAA